MTRFHVVSAFAVMERNDFISCSICCCVIVDDNEGANRAQHIAAAHPEVNE